MAPRDDGGPDGCVVELSGLNCFKSLLEKTWNVEIKVFFFPRQVYQVNNYMHGLRSVVAVLSMNIISDIYLKA